MLLSLGSVQSVHDGVVLLHSTLEHLSVILEAHLEITTAITSENQSERCNQNSGSITLREKGFYVINTAAPSPLHGKRRRGLPTPEPTFLYLAHVITRQLLEVLPSGVYDVYFLFLAALDRVRLDRKKIHIVGGGYFRQMRWLKRLYQFNGLVEFNGLLASA